MIKVGDKVKYVKHYETSYDQDDNYDIEIGDVGIVNKIEHDEHYYVDFPSSKDKVMFKEEIELVEGKTEEPKFEIGDEVYAEDQEISGYGIISYKDKDLYFVSMLYNGGIKRAFYADELSKVDDIGIAKESTTARQNKYYNRIMDGFAAGMMTTLANDIEKSFTKGRKQSKTQKFMNVIKNTFKSKKQKALEHFSIVDGSGDLTARGRDEFIDYLWATDDKAKKDFVEKIVEAYEEDK